MRPFFNRKKPSSTGKERTAVICPERQSGSFFRLEGTEDICERELYEQLRRRLPVVDAAIGKIIRLTGGFKVACEDEKLQKQLEQFCACVPVGLASVSLGSFLEEYLDSLLTYGKAVGEILINDRTGDIVGLCTADPSVFHVREGVTPAERVYYCRLPDGTEKIMPHPERILFTALGATPTHPEGVSILRGVPALAEILEKIYRCVGKNFERVGNVRYAVISKPDPEEGPDSSEEKALAIAKEWSNGMQSAKNGVIKDFVAVGDIDIRVIGAENQIIDTQVPVRQLLEQILSKLSIPPFLLGLNWTSTERMSCQQVDILTSELEYYRRLLEPVIREIAGQFLRTRGYSGMVEIIWDNINLQDESELSKARYYNAQAEALELENALKKQQIAAKRSDKEDNTDELS